MRFDVLLLAALPSAMASKLAYSPPANLMSMASTQDSNCVLPAGFTVQDFKARSNDTGNTLQAFDFKYADQETGVNTLCHFNETSKSTTPDTLTPRFACENSDVKFIWQDDKGSLTLVERICPTASGYVLDMHHVHITHWHILLNFYAVPTSTRSRAARFSPSRAATEVPAPPTRPSHRPSLPASSP